MSSSENDTCITRRHETDSDSVNPRGGRSKSNKGMYNCLDVCDIEAYGVITLVLKWLSHS